MHMDMNMSMHMRMGTNTNRVIALGTNIDLDLSPHENNDGYDCGHAYEYTYAYAYAHGHVNWHGYRYGCVYGYACGSVDQGDVTCHLISLLARAEFIHCRYTVIFLTHLLFLIEIASRTRHFFSRPTIPPVPVRPRLTSSTLMFHITAVHDCRYHPAPASFFFLTAPTLQKSRG